MSATPPSIPDHELLKRVGRGAYGEVWIARSVTGAYRAAKIVTRSSFDHGRPFEREFEGILKFEPISRLHDSQVDILHVGRGDGYFYYVMELADDVVTGGQINPDNYHPRTLKSDVFHRARIPFEECVQIGLALSTALEHLHENGLVHRDVKPSNIIFVNGVPKLADIGLVAGIDATHTSVGTEGFAAPEGSGAPQADIYSLGKVLYEIATGKDRQEFPELPTQLRELPDREGLMELNAVITRACRHDPADRYASAAEIRADLELLQSGKSLARLHRVERRLRNMARAGIAIGALALLAVGGFWFQAVQTREARRLAEQNERIANDNRALAERNRAQIVQLNKANGFRQMEDGDIGGAMLWFGNALKYTTNNVAEAEMDRRRLSMLLQLHPKPVTRISLFETNELRYRSLSRDGERLLLESGRKSELWELTDRPHRIAAWPRSITQKPGKLSEDGRFVVFSDTNRPIIEIWSVNTETNITRRELNVGFLEHLRLLTREKRILGVNTNQALVVLDAETGKLIREVARFEAPILTLATAGNRIVACFLTNDLARIFNWETGEFIAETSLKGRRVEISAPNARFHSILPAFDTRDQRIRGGSVQVWDAQTGRMVGPPLAHSEIITRSVTSRDGRLVATASRPSEEVRIWNTVTGDLICPPIKFRPLVQSFFFSPDNTRLAVGCGHGTVLVCDVRSGRFLTPPLAHERRAGSPEFVLNGAALVAYDDGGVVTIWDLTSIEATGVTLETPSDVERLQFSEAGGVLLAQCSKSSILWNTTNWQPVASITHPSAMASTFSVDGHYLAVANEGNGAQVYEAQTGKVLGAVVDGTNTFRRLVFNRDSSLLVTLSSDGVIRFWDWRQTNQVGAPFKHPVGQAFTFALSRRGDRLLSMTLEEGTVPGERIHHTGFYRSWLWNVDQRTLITNGTSLAQPYGSRSAVFSPDGSKWIDFGPNFARVMDATSGARTTGLITHGDTVNSAEFSPDGKSVLTFGLDNVRISDAITGVLRVPPIVHSPIPYAKFIDHGRQVLTLNANDSLQCWDAATSLPLLPSITTEPAERFVSHPDGRFIATAMRDQRIVIRDLGRNLSEDELQRSVPLVTARLISTNGTVSFLPLGDLVRVTTESQAAEPGQFQFDLAKRIRWHKQQVTQFGSLPRLESSLFHLDRLLELEPGNPKWLRQREQLAAKLIPSRALSASSRLIDLTGFYTDSLHAMGSLFRAELPLGIQLFAGTEFDVRGVILLDQPVSTAGNAAFVANRVKHIRVGQHCDRLQFLHAVRDSDWQTGGAPEGIEVARWIVHYADGSQRIWPVRYGLELRDWASKKEAKLATIAFERTAQSADGSTSLRKLFKMTWENPWPEVEITYLDFEIGDQPTRPFVVAITAE